MLRLIVLAVCVFLGTAGDSAGAESQNPPGLLIEIIHTGGPLPPLPPLPELGNAAAGEKLYQPCASCHGAKPAKLIGKSEGVLMAAMQNIQMGTFSEPSKLRMQRMLNGLTQDQLVDIAAYLKNMQP